MPSVQLDPITHLLLDPLGFSTCRGWSRLTQTRCTEGERGKQKPQFVWLKLSISAIKRKLLTCVCMLGVMNHGDLGGWAIRSTKTTDLIATPCLIMCDQMPPSHDTAVWPQQSSCCPSWLLLDFGNRWFHLNLSLKVGFDRVGVGVLYVLIRMT